MFAKFIVAFLALSTLANAAPAARRGVSVAIDGHPIHLRDLDAAPAMRRGVSIAVDGHTIRLRDPDAAPAMRRAGHTVAVQVNGHIHVRDPAGPLSANSQEFEKKLASDIAKDLKKVQHRDLSDFEKRINVGKVIKGFLREPAPPTTYSHDSEKKLASEIAKDLKKVQLREPSPPAANSHDFEKTLASDIAKDLKKVHARETRPASPPPPYSPPHTPPPPYSPPHSPPPPYSPHH